MTPDFLWVGMAGLVVIAVIIAAMTANKRGSTPGERERTAERKGQSGPAKPAQHAGAKS